MENPTRPRPFKKAESGPGRLRPVSDPLESVGFPSKGDKTLLDYKAQEDYYNKIVERYMRFCAQHSHDLDAAWASLPTSASADATRNPPAAPPIRPAPASTPPPPHRSSTESQGAKSVIQTPSPQKGQVDEEQRPVRSAAAELSTLLLSLRKLREAILATSSTTPIPFAQRVHIFSIRLSILARHPPSYFPSLRYLLDNLHSAAHPLTASELTEFTSYLILDYACRQSDMAAAYALWVHARTKHGFQSVFVDRALAALMHDNWVLFWRTRKAVDGYMRAIMNWAADHVRRRALKAIGKTYMSVNVHWLVENCTGEDDWTWEKLVEKEKLGWHKEGDSIQIRKPKCKT
ncbi:hypothetical protein VTN77DRAFT_5776 [Rasamsonia byssochlamydoides]|uniref:uncharacterized protein n=1 Tax=Rasamsonia byssochlamydoides TaxID=89139 RepID=UPI0037446EDA